MSLTSYFRDSSEARRRVMDAIRKPLVGPVLGAPIAPALSKRYGLVGTAFDYLFRSFLVREHKGQELIHTGSPCLALLTIPEFSTSAYGRKKLGKLRQAYDVRVAYEAGELNLSSTVAHACLVLATFDVVMRVGQYQELAGLVEDDDVEDLLHLAALVPSTHFRAGHRLILNPLFHQGWRVFGADGDVVIDDLLVDIKVTKQNKLQSAYLHQLTGYLALERLGGIVGAGDQPIRRLGVYFARHGVLHTWSVTDLYQPGALPKLVTWLDEQWPGGTETPPTRTATLNTVGSAEERRSFLQVQLEASTSNDRVPSPFAPPTDVPQVRSALVARRVGWALLGEGARENDVLTVAGLLASSPMAVAPMEYVRTCLADVDRTRTILAESKHTDIWYVSTDKKLVRRCARILNRLNSVLSAPLPEEEAVILGRLLPISLPLNDHGHFTRHDRSLVKRLVERGLVMQDGTAYLRLDMNRYSPLTSLNDAAIHQPLTWQASHTPERPDLSSTEEGRAHGFQDIANELTGGQPLVVPAKLLSEGPPEKNTPQSLDLDVPPDSGPLEIFGIQPALIKPVLDAVFASKIGSGTGDKAVIVKFNQDKHFFQFVGSDQPGSFSAEILGQTFLPEPAPELSGPHRDLLHTHHWQIGDGIDEEDGNHRRDFSLNDQNVSEIVRHTAGLAFALYGHDGQPLVIETIQL